MCKPIPATPGEQARYDYEYKRNGVANLFMMFEPLAERMDNIRRLEKEVMAWVEKRNAKEAKVDRRFTTRDARIKLKKLYPSID